MTVVLVFTPEREAALQSECDAYNVANAPTVVSLQSFVQLLLDARADANIRLAVAAAEATPQKVAELRTTIREKDAEIARLQALKDAGAVADVPVEVKTP